MIALGSTVWDKVGIPSRGLALQSAIRNGLPYDVFLQIAELTRIDKRELAASLAISPVILYRRAKTGQFTSDESDKLYRFTDALITIIDLFEGNKDEAITWLQSDIKGIGNNRPLDMLSTSAGCKAVIEIVGRLEHGVFV